MDERKYSLIRNFSPTLRDARDVLQVDDNSESLLRWGDFCAMVENAWLQVSQVAGCNIVLKESSSLLFLAWLLALVRAGFVVHIPGNQGAENLLAEKYPIVGGELSKVYNGGRVSQKRQDSVEPAIVFHTSGSTGEPKPVKKSLSCVEHEITTLGSMWGELYQDSVVLSTVGHEHFYGFLFSAAVPFFFGGLFMGSRIQYPESIYPISSKRKLLISSPAFLKRCTDLGGSQSAISPLAVFSSGGLLPSDLAATIAQKFGCSLFEVYGSTETGGIAWRTHPHDLLWKPFTGIDLVIGDDGILNVKSPYLAEPGWFPTGDLAVLFAENCFELHGRSDSIVKIEEKRVSLLEVERLLLETGLVDDCAVLPFQDARQYLAAVLVLNNNGREVFLKKGKLGMNRLLSQSLLNYLDPTVLPKKWRYCPSLPRNAQGKLSRASLEELFKK